MICPDPPRPAPILHMLSNLEVFHDIEFRHHGKPRGLTTYVKLGGSGAGLVPPRPPQTPPESPPPHGRQKKCKRQQSGYPFPCVFKRPPKSSFFLIFYPEAVPDQFRACLERPVCCKFTTEGFRAGGHARGTEIKPGFDFGT